MKRPKKTGTRRQRKRDRPSSNRFPLPLRVKFPTLRLFSGSYVKLKKIFQRAWALVAGIGVVIGIAISIYPRISVSPSPLLYPPDPFTARFVIANEGYLRINNVKCLCFYQNVLSENKVMWEKSIAPDELDIPTIESGEKASFECSRPPFTSTQIQRADIDISVSFKPSLIPWQIEKAFRFVGEPTADGSLHWFPQPLSKK
jgi:hypothetical protein